MEIQRIRLIRFTWPGEHSIHKNNDADTGIWVLDFFLSILSIKCAPATYMNLFDMPRCEISAFMNYASFS